MKTRNSFTKNKRKIIRYTGIALIVIGLLVIIWPLYINFIMARREVAILTSWEEELKSLQNTTSNTVNNVKEDEKNQQLKKETRLIDPEKKLPFRITIPKIDVDWLVNEGTDYATLRKGPGHFAGSALPGETGTCLVAGHRTTYGAPFNRLDELEKGDKILLETTGNEKFTYIVTRSEAVLPTDMTVVENTSYPSLVLSTCTPKYFATRRLIVHARIAE